MLTLYFTPATCALASHIALEQAGANYQAVCIDFSRNEQQSPDYLRVNPKGRVPALVTVRQFTSPTRTSGAATAGPMIRRPSRPCRRRCPRT
jgi:glutathione S-transferase